MICISFHSICCCCQWRPCSTHLILRSFHEQHSRRAWSIKPFAHGMGCQRLLRSCQLKQAEISCWALLHVVVELCGVQQIHPVRLVWVHIVPQILLQHPIDSLHLPIRLRMIRSVHQQLHPHKSEQLCPKPPGEPRVSIWHNAQR